MKKQFLAVGACCALLPAAAVAQSAAARQREEAISTSISYVFATDLGSGVYDLSQGETPESWRLLRVAD